jgi:hypothetical protein
LRRIHEERWQTWDACCSCFPAHARGWGIRSVERSATFDALGGAAPFAREGGNGGAANVRITAESIDFDHLGTPHHYTVDLKTLDPVAVRCSTFNQDRRGQGGGYYCELEYKDGRPLPWPKGRTAKDRPPPPPVKELFRLTWSFTCLVNNTQEVAGVAYWAQAYAAAINRLIEFARNPSHPLRNFTQQATAWRALPTKPPIPEAVRVQRLMAEDSVKEKKPASALIYYERGLEVYPTWPQGYFNAALIAAELGLYGSAVEHMQSYLELVPDAPDAQPARDQIVIWRTKAG